MAATTSRILAMFVESRRSPFAVPSWSCSLGRVDDEGWQEALDGLYGQVRAAVQDDADHWERRAHEVVGPFAARWSELFLAWAKQDDRWRLTVAEAATRVCAKPREAAAFILVEGLRERLIDDGFVEDED